MIDWVSLATFAGGGTASEIVRATVRGSRAWRRRHYPNEFEARREQLELAEQELRIARDTNKMLAATLEVYRTELATLGERVDALDHKLQVSDDEQERLKVLLRHAVSVLRDFLAIAREHNLPAPEMSADLAAEIERG